MIVKQIETKVENFRHFRSKVRFAQTRGVNLLTSKKGKALQNLPLDKQAYRYYFPDGFGELAGFAGGLFPLLGPEGLPVLLGALAGAGFPISVEFKGVSKFNVILIELSLINDKKILT